MDFRPKSPARVAFSFAAGTFDLRAWCPGLCYEGDHGKSTAVWLDDRWDCLLDAIRELGFILASVRTGSLSLAVAWPQADFQHIPGTHELVEWHTGTELRRDKIGAVNAVVEEHSGQQMASLQFFDRQGLGCLKLMLTDASQIHRFKDLLLSHATLKPWGPAFSSRPKQAISIALPSAAELKDLREQVSVLWQSLGRTLPGDHFPGLAATPRYNALAAMEDVVARKLRSTTLQKVLEWATQQKSVLQTTVRNHVVYTSAECHFVKTQPCGCGCTFFGHHAQMTLRSSQDNLNLWAVEYPGKNVGSNWRVEIYDDQRHFIAQIALPAGQSSSTLASWQNVLTQGRLR